MTFFTLDDDQIPADELEVLNASSALQITEFQLFELAYERWFGEVTDEKHIEKYFTVYMFSRIVPPWVRQFCREVIKQDRDGALDPAQFGVFPREESVTMFQKGINYILCVLVVLISMHIVAYLVTRY